MDFLKYFVETYTNEGDTVIDSTCGSGGLGVTAEQLNRNYILNDKSLYWCEVSKLRIVNKWDLNPPDKKYLKQVLRTLKEKLN